VTALAKLFRSAAFRVSIASLVVFAVFAGFIVLYIGNRASELYLSQAEQANNEEIAALADDYRAGGIRLLAMSIQERALTPGASLYVLTDALGTTLIGNVADFPLSVLGLTDGISHAVAYRLIGEGAETREAMVRVFVLAGGLRLVVGRDIGERSQIWAVVRDALWLVAGLVIGLGLLSWWFIWRTVLRRVDAMAATSQHIMSGDLTRRLDVTGSGDEFDRLAASLNAMLARIEQLLVGLKEVSDNIAHDLKTPLTRLRNRVEASLRSGRGEPEYRRALEATIEDSDQLIRTFDALLRIARVESASVGDEMAPVDAAEVLRDVEELYEPVAEEAGLGLDVVVEGPLPLFGNRELISQALANLVDNAIKYAALSAGGAASDDAARVTLRGERRDGRIRLSVIDRGPGISAADRARAVQRFVRLESSRTQPGSGLGLSLVAAVARLHAGTLELGDAHPGLAATLDLPAAWAEVSDGGRRLAAE